MYKRRGRILFLDPGSGSRARMAEAWALALGGEWIEPQAAALRPGPLHPQLAAVMAEVGVTVATATCPPWADLQAVPRDLVVPLDLGTGEDWSAILNGARAKRWALAGVCPPGDAETAPAALRVCRDGLRERVSGILGGFRMKAREADSQPPMPNDGKGQ